MIEFKNFSKYYGATPILKIEYLRLDTGIHWVQGENGSGKSTLLKAMAGILHFNGSISLPDISLKKHPVEYRRLVNFGESEPLYPGYLTGWDMIRLFASAKMASEDQISYYVESLEMRNYLDDPLAGYSTGMTKKLSLVLGFLGNPKLILLDEPFITLDKKSTLQLAQWIKDGYEQKGISFILTSHQAVPEIISLNNTFVMKDQTLKASGNGSID